MNSLINQLCSTCRIMLNKIRINFEILPLFPFDVFFSVITCPVACLILLIQLLGRRKWPH